MNTNFASNTLPITKKGVKGKIAKITGTVALTASLLACGGGEPETITVDYAEIGMNQLTQLYPTDTFQKTFQLKPYKKLFPTSVQIEVSIPEGTNTGRSLPSSINVNGEEYTVNTHNNFRNPNGNGKPIGSIGIVEIPVESKEISVTISKYSLKNDGPISIDITTIKYGNDEMRVKIANATPEVMTYPSNIIELIGSVNAEGQVSAVVNIPENIRPKSMKLRLSARNIGTSEILFQTIITGIAVGVEYLPIFKAQYFPINNSFATLDISLENMPFDSKSVPISFPDFKLQNGTVLSASIVSYEVHPNTTSTQEVQQLGFTNASFMLIGDK